MLKKRLEELIPQWREEISAINKEHGNMVISDVNIGQAYGGMRGVKGMVCDTSEVPPDKGLHHPRHPRRRADRARLPEESLLPARAPASCPTAKPLKALQKDLAARQGARLRLEECSRPCPRIRTRWRCSTPRSW